MEVNITLILQMMQFGCAYYVLYRFVFAPALHILQEDERFKHTLYKKLEHEQHLKETLLAQYHAKNNVFKEKLVQAIPVQVMYIDDQKSIASITSYHVENVELSSQEREQVSAFLVDHLSQVIKK